MRLPQRVKFTRTAAVRRERRFTAGPESLEGRALLSTTSVTFQPPNAPELLAEAQLGDDSDAFTGLVTYLQNSVTENVSWGSATHPTPTTDTVGTIDAWVAGFEQYSTVNIKPLNTRLDALDQDQGQSLSSTILTEALESSDGLPIVGLATGATEGSDKTFNQYVFTSNPKMRFEQNSNADFLSAAYASVTELTRGRALWPVGTPDEEFLIRSRQATAGLDSIVDAIQDPSKPDYQLTKAFKDSRTNQANVVEWEADAYKEDVLTATTDTDAFSQNVADTVVVAAEDLQHSVNQAVLFSRTNREFRTSVERAVKEFEATLVGPSGLFGSEGPYAASLIQPPHIKDPLIIDYAATFENLHYTRTGEHSEQSLYRYVKDPAKPFGNFLTPSDFPDPAAAISQLAISQSWNPQNSATVKVQAKIPNDVAYYDGIVAPIYQGVYERDQFPDDYPGGAEQILINSYKIDWKDITEWTWNSQSDSWVKYK